MAKAHELLMQLRELFDEKNGDRFEHNLDKSIALAAEAKACKTNNLSYMAWGWHIALRAIKHRDTKSPTKEYEAEFDQLETALTERHCRWFQCSTKNQEFAIFYDQKKLALF